MDKPIKRFRIRKTYDDGYIVLDEHLFVCKDGKVTPYPDYGWPDAQKAGINVRMSLSDAEEELALLYSTHNALSPDAPLARVGITYSEGDKSGSPSYLMLPEDAARTKAAFEAGNEFILVTELSGSIRYFRRSSITVISFDNSP